MADQQQNTAFYLKYRPKSLEELVGQTAVKKILLSAFQEQRLSHAYLFVGPRGTGKTSTARILAKMVNCERATSIPCNKCSTCLSITDGSNLDLIEIDAASNRGIEDIRALRERIKLAPSASRKKVYIIDEVHMLTAEAFNALLKTLEEPPEHALFILATTDVTKLPPTILSRVQRLDFKLAKPEELRQALTKIIKEEKIIVDEEALKLLIKKSDGSFRDGVKLLDQVSTVKGKVTVAVLGDFLRSSSFDNTLELIESLAKKDTKKGLLLIAEQVEGGAEIKELLLTLMEVLRNLVFMKNGLGEQLVSVHLPEEKYQSLVKLADQFISQDLIKNLDILQKALEKLKFASIPSLPLEVAVVEICEQSTVIARNEMTKQSSSEVDPDKIATLIARNDSETEGSSVPLESSTETLNQVQHDNSSDILKLKEKWTYVCETIRPYNFSLEALLRSISIRECTETSVIMEVPYSFHQRILEAPKNRDLLEGVFSEILGRSIKLSTVLGSRPQRREDIANIEVAQDDEIIRVAAEIFNSDSIN